MICVFFTRAVISLTLGAPELQVPRMGARVVGELPPVPRGNQTPESAPNLWFSNFSGHQNHPLEGLFKYRGLAPDPCL